MSPPTRAAALATESALPVQQMYTVPQVMNVLQLSKSVVYGLITSGELGSCKIGRSRRVSQAQLERYIASASQSPAA